MILQRSLCPSIDDVNNGWDNIHIEVNDQIQSAYGGIERIAFFEKSVVIEVNSTTASRLRTHKTIVIDVKDVQVNFCDLTQALNLVCENYACITNESSLHRGG